VANLARSREIIELLRQTTSLGVVSEFLKSKNLRFSAGSWDEMRDKRLLPALELESINNDELLSLLRSAEENGKQHVFLYTCSGQQAIELMGRDRITGVLRTRRELDLLTSPPILMQPEQPTVVDVRWDTARVDLRLTIKEVELRSQQRYIRTEVDGNTLRKIYHVVRERVVNIARLHRSGMLEIRIGSHENSTRYQDDVNRIWNQVRQFLPRTTFRELSLTTAKARLLTDREGLRDTIRYADATLRNDNGTALRIATGSEESDLSSDTGASASLDAFMSHEATCEGHNIYFKPAPGLASEVHVLMSGAVNEFAVPANCSAEDYEYVLDQIRHLNRRVS
jgi:hypothetical protein